MSGEDMFRQDRTRVRWSRIDPDLPGGLHRPKRRGDIGWDLEAMRDVVIPPMASVDVPVNCQVWLPEGFYADIRNRSSMGKRNLYVDTNLIDTGYRGPLFVLIRNMTLPKLTQSMFGDPQYANHEDYIDGAGAIVVKAGERIAQLVFHRHTPVWEAEVEQVPMDTERAGAGFGSTGR